MFPKINWHAHFGGPLQYNEEKVKEGKAETIGAANFLKDHDQLTLQDKINRFEQRTTLNETVLIKSDHISLGFDATDILTNEKMAAIGDRFMERMSYEDQPYVIYRHYDSGHPHLHIVTVNIDAEGEKIHIRPAALAESHKICRELEVEFSLRPSTAARQDQQDEFSVLHAKKVVYGESGLKRAVSDVLNAVVDQYQYTSMDEFNAILWEYNVVANPGSENSHLQKLGGLYYHVLDENGERIGVPLKASEFLLKPTLNRLEENFSLNQSLRESSRERLQTVIDWSLAGQATDWTGWRDDLERDGVSVVISKSRVDSAEHLYFIDHKTKSAFSGESLGDRYTLDAIRERCRPEERLIEEEIPSQRLKIGL
jgi:hypothetical protein